jgi:hypothetical protein
MAHTLRRLVSDGQDEATGGYALLAQGLGEVAVVRDDEDTTLEDLEGSDERGERLAVEVVCRYVSAFGDGTERRARTRRLVHADDVRATPCSSAEHDLDLLATGETAHGVVRDELGLETEVGHVLLDLATDERAVHAETLRLTGVDLEHFL